MAQVLSSRKKKSLSLVLSWTRTVIFIGYPLVRWVCPWCFLLFPDSRLMAPLRGSSGCCCCCYYNHHIQEGPCGPRRIRTDTVEGGGEGAPHHPTPHSRAPTALTALYSECVLSSPAQPAIFLPLPFQKPPSLCLPDVATAEALSLAVPGCTWLVSAQPIYPLGRARSGHLHGAH